MEWFIRMELRYFRMKGIGKYISSQLDLLISWQVNYKNKNKNTKKIGLHWLFYVAAHCKLIKNKSYVADI